MTRARPHQSIRVFKNPYLEKLTHVHPATPLLLWVPIVIFLFQRALLVAHFSVASVLALAIFGMLAWTATEYFLHRWIFHFPARGAFQERIQFLIHGLHHDDPQDPTRLVMPPVVSLFLGVVFFSFFRGFFALVGVADASYAFYAGFSIGYLCYDYVHYGVHHFTPRSRLGKRIKQNHMMHHYATPDALWGVSSPIWDYIMGTVQPVKSRRRGPRSPDERLNEHAV